MDNDELAAMLNAYFNWNKCRMHCFFAMLLALIKVRTVNLRELACGFSSLASIESRYKAEGAGEYARHEKHRFYRMVKRSATECAAILDIGLKLGLISTKKLSDARDLLFRIVSMIIKMVSASH